MKHNKLLVTIIIIFFLIILILISLFILNNKNNKEKINNNDNNNISTQEETDQELNQTYENVPPEFTPDISFQQYFTVSECIRKYLDVLYLDASIYDDVQIRINSLRSKSSNNGVTTYNEKTIFTPVKIIKAQTDGVMIFKAYGILSNINMEYIRDTYFIVNLDDKNQTFSIEQLNGNYSDLDEINVSNLEQIEKNDYNNFKYTEINDEFIYKQIFENMKRLMLVKPEIAYEKLEDNYKTKRFENYDNFKEYIDNNREKLIGINPESYKKYDNNKIQISDQYSNWYEFNIIGAMNYKAKIDNYIVLYDSDLADYEEYSDEEKVKYNINRWLTMINNKDYKKAYQYLDETFRSNNYSAEEDFREDVESIMSYSVNNYTINADGNVFVIELEISTEEDFSDRYMNIIMLLKDNADFTLSFSNQ